MSVCVLQNLEKDRVLWTDFLASCREINRFSVSKIGPEPAKPTISLALGATLWFSAIFKKGNNLCDFIFVSLDICNPSKMLLKEMGVVGWCDGPG